MAFSNTLENHSQDYKGPVISPPASLGDLKWWNRDLQIKLQNPLHDVIIDSDAWTGEFRAWSCPEATLHINSQKLLVVTLAVHSFTKHKPKMSMLLTPWQYLT